jgi:anti-anti-sigma factor
MNGTAEIYGQAVVLAPRGELTDETLPALRETVEHHTQSDDVRDLVLDMAAVPFMDSAAMEYLLEMQDHLAERLGQVRLVGCDENIRKILEMTHLDETFETFTDVEQAVKDSGF